MELTTKYLQLQEIANPRCTECYGEGEIYKHFANYKDKYVLFEWLYCSKCFPDSSGSWPSEEDLVEIDGNEFDKLLKEGYSDNTGW